MTQETGLGSRQDRKIIASAIQRHLDANGLARKDLIREHLSKSSIEKLFQGDFTERTLNKVEGILKTSFQRQAQGQLQGQLKVRDDTAAKSVGGYVFDAVEYLQGDYLCVRPMFANPANFNAYLISIAWSDAQKCLTFEEKSRFDGKYRQVGTVYIPFGTAFMNLVSSSAGNVRTVLLSLPDTEDMMRGIISTLSNPKGSIYIPVAAPIVLRKLRTGEEPEFGVIARDNRRYDEYQSWLATVLTEEFGIFAVPQPPAPRKEGRAGKP
ncbi:MAG: hypothetical protein Q8M18_10760 [Bradyrhizobium sp.]|nr:hypothetical protein [Bradyrhizobium sp.]